MISNPPRTEPIKVIGIGLDGRLGLSETIIDFIENATVLAGAKRHLSYFPEHQATQIILKDLQQDLDSIIECALAGEKVVVLASGDPLFFGLGRLLKTKIDPEKLSFYPHLSSIQLAFSKIKIPWQDARLISVHGRDCAELLKSWQQGASKIAVLTDRVNNPVAIAKQYLALKPTTLYDFFVCENLTLADATLHSFDAENIIELAKLAEDTFNTLNILILLKKAEKTKLDLAQLPLLGLDDNSFLSFSDRPSLITKKEIRTLILGELALQPEQTIWDIGAGTGSISVEIARLVPSASICAVEKTAMGINLITKNCDRFGLKNIQPIPGSAPQSLRDLPMPNRIFIGGSGGNLSQILETCKKNIHPQGIIVLAFATIEHTTAAINWAKQNQWQYHALQVQISRALPVANLTRFSPLNPVNIIRLQPNA